jgi:hypothetical protein
MNPDKPIAEVLADWRVPRDNHCLDGLNLPGVVHNPPPNYTQADPPTVPTQEPSVLQLLELFYPHDSKHTPPPPPEHPVTATPSSQPTLPTEQEPPSEDPPFRRFGRPVRYNDTLTIPRFSEILSEYLLDRVIGIPGITDEIMSLFLVAVFPSTLDDATAWQLLKQVRARLAQPLETAELHLNFRRSLAVPRLQICAPNDARAATLQISGTCSEANGVAIISNSMCLRLPVAQDGKFSGIFPCPQNLKGKLVVYSLNNQRLTRSRSQEFPIPPRQPVEIVAPAFDVLGVIDTCGLNSGGQSPAALRLADIAAKEVRPYPSLVTTNGISPSQRTVCQRVQPSQP